MLAKIFFLLTLISHQCLASQSFYTYNDYEDQIFYNNSNFLNTHRNYAPLPLISHPNYNYEINERQIIPESKLYRDESREDITQQPEQSAAVSEDPNILFVPRLGLVRGQHNFKVIKNRQISAYLGLQYGLVKPGLGRFQKASPVLFTENLIDATKETANCPQFPELETVKEKASRQENVDDCLTLNIFTPTKSNSYPVLVFVHGEMLFDGGANEGQPDYFLENDIVLVTINYRLAPFGYLSTLTNDMPGNVVLSDIQMSLEWIQNYIRSFNGNPERVTLMGQAGGATLVHALSISGKAEGLFQKLILQSGTALNPYFLDEQPLNTLQSFARHARCPPSTNTEGLISCFDRMSTVHILQYFKSYFENNEPKGLQFINGFKLIVGDKLGYLPKHPASILTNSTKPLIVGVTKDVGAFIMSRFYKQFLQLRSQNISDYINVVLKHTTKPYHYTLWRQWALKHIFTIEDARNPTVSALVQKLLELTNMILYRGPVIDSIRNTYKNYSTYMYCFDYRGEYHRFGHLRNPLPFEIDATLSDDNIFLFPYPDEVSQLNILDKAMSKIMVAMWVNFATSTNGNINISTWPNVSSEYGPFLRFTNTQETRLELDYHFGEGIPVPNLYPQYFNTTDTIKYPASRYSHQSPYLNNQEHSSGTHNSPHPTYKQHETISDEMLKKGQI